VKLIIHGPNLNDQTKGEFHVHASPCRDNTREVRENGSVNPMVVDANSVEDVVTAIYADHMAEHPEADDPYGSWQAYEHDFHFAPCVKIGEDGSIATPELERRTPAPSRNPIRKRDVRVGSTYAVKVGAQVVEVRLDAESRLGGWVGTNLVTGRQVRIKSAAKLRRVINDNSKGTHTMATTTKSNGNGNGNGGNGESVTAVPEVTEAQKQQTRQAKLRSQRPAAKSSGAKASSSKASTKASTAKKSTGAKAPKAAKVEAPKFEWPKPAGELLVEYLTERVSAEFNAGQEARPYVNSNGRLFVHSTDWAEWLDSKHIGGSKMDRAEPLRQIGQTRATPIPGTDHRLAFYSGPVPKGAESLPRRAANGGAGGGAKRSPLSRLSDGQRAVVKAALAKYTVPKDKAVRDELLELLG